MAKAELTINGRKYALACAPDQEQRLQELGAKFDQRIQELIGAFGDIGPERLFLAAGLSLLDELDAVDAAAGGKALDARIENLERKAATVLLEAATRIEAISRRVDEAS